MQESRHPGDVRLHLRPARAQGRHQRLHDGDRHRDRAAVGPGDNCYVDERQGTTTPRSRSSSSGWPTDGITPANTEFVIGAEENDQFAGANVGRATEPTPAGCDGVTTPCNYATGPDR